MKTKPQRNWCYPLLAMVYFLIPGCNTKPPDSLGIQDGRLAPCPRTPNCVSTYASDERHRVDPLPFSLSSEEMIDRLVRLIEQQERAVVITRKKDYLHGEFRSKWFGFVDDVEFQLDETRKLLHFRSASRMGKSDLGVNRQRWKKLKGQLIQQINPGA